MQIEKEGRVLNSLNWASLGIFPVNNIKMKTKASENKKDALEPKVRS